MRRRIFWGVTVVALVVLGVGVVMAGAIGRQFERQVRNDLFRQAEATATVIASQLQEALDRRDSGSRLIDTPLALVETLDTVERVGGHDRVEVGVVVGDEVRPVGRDTVLLPERPPEVRRDLFEQTVEGEELLVALVVIDVDSRGRPLPAVVAIGRSTDLPGSGLGGPLLAAIGVGTLLAVALAAWLARVTGSRLDALAEASRRLAAGDFSARAPEFGEDEVAHLGGAFNEMAARLEGAQRRERDFIMSVSHDLRTPLTTIRGYAEALEAGEVPDGDRARVGGVLRAQTERLRRLVDDLMLLGRLEAGEYTIHTEEVDLAAHLGAAVDAFSPTAQASQVRLRSSIGDVGSITTDPERVEQVLGNLLDNALRHTPEGGTITVGLGEDAGWVRLTVTDTGTGIDPADLDRVFDRHFVADRHRPVRPEGSGLGLAIARQLTDLLGGSIAVESEPGHGTTFIVALPAR